MNKKLLLFATLFCMSISTLLQATPAGPTPTIARAYSDRFINEISPSRQTGVIGDFDITFGTDGSLDLTAQGAGYRAQVIKTLADGSVFVGLSKSTTGDHSILVKYTSTGVVDTNFGTAGSVSFGSQTRMSHAMMIDQQNRILVGGCNEADGAIGWLNRVSADGSTYEAIIDSQDEANEWVFVGEVATQTTGKIIVLGQKQGSSKYTRIARYNTDLTLDTTFGNSGYILFDGNTANLPASVTILYSMVINNQDAMYIPYLNGTSVYVAKFLASGAIDTSWGINGSVGVSLLNGATNFQLHIAADLHNNLIVAAQVGANVIVTGITSAGGSIGGFSNYMMTGGDTYNVTAIITTTDGTQGKIFLIGCDSTAIESQVTCLQESGELDTIFNNPNGYNQFEIDAIDISASSLLNATLAPDGRLYAVGYEINAGVVTPYLSRFFNFSGVSQVAQYPSLQAQGSFDITFGGSDVNSGDGIIRPFNGLYGASLQQTTNAVIELASGKILVGMTGKLDDSNNSNMMLANLNADGSLNTSFSPDGKVDLVKVLTNEYLTSIIEDKDGNLLVAGHDGGTNAILRKYPTGGSTGVATWAKANSLGGVNKYFGVAIQASQRILAFGQLDATHGMIYAYLPNGNLDSGSFNSAGVSAGKITGADFAGTPLQYMGPIYAYAIDSADNIYIAYKNNSTGFVDVALIYYNGRGLVQEFNPEGTTPGIVDDVFGATVANPQDVRIALDNEGNLVVAAAIDGNYVLKSLFAVEAFVDSTYDTVFGTSGTMTVAVGTAAVINQLTVLNDNTILVTGADNATDDSMVIVRATEDGDLDTTFNAQGATPGVLSFQVGNVVSNYDTRVATGLVIQAATGNMIVTGYEKQTATLSVPMVMHIYGKPGTTQVKQSSIDNSEVAGTLDTTFNIQDDGTVTDGSIDLSLIDASLTGSTKAVYAYRTESSKQGYYLVGVDTGTHTKIARIRQNDNSLDASFGGETGIVTLASITGINHISVDAEDKILVTGIHAGAGWAQRVTSAGVVDVAFESFGDLVEINGLYQQKSGRYVVVGKNSSGNGVLVAFQNELVAPATRLAVDTTFNPLAQVNGIAAQTTPGWFVVSTTSSGLYNLIINSDDTIVVAYKDTTVKLQKITANGSGRTTSFNSGNVLDTTIVPSSPSGIRCAIDAQGKIVVGASVGGNTISTVRYSSAGVIDTDFNGGAIYTITPDKLGSAGVELTSLITTSEQAPATDDKIVLIGYNTAGGNARLFAARLGNDQTATNGILDSTIWNTDPSGSDVAGLTTFNVNGNTSGTATAMYDASIYINGTIYGAVAGPSGKALLVRLFGDSYIDQNEQQPFEVLPGIIDTTLDTATPGSEALNFSQFYFDCALSGYTANKIYIYPSGESLIGLSNGIDIKLVRLKADFSLDTSFGVGGVATSTAGQYLHDFVVGNGENDDSSIYVTGQINNGEFGNAFAAHFSATGEELPFGVEDYEGNWWLYFIFNYMDDGLAIRRTKNSRTLIAGSLVGYGAIIAYDNYAYSSDTMFGNVFYNLYIPLFDYEYEGGLINTNPITDIAVDSFDRIYTVQKNMDNSIDVVRLFASGSGPDSEFDANVLTGTNLSATQLKVALDEGNGHLVVAVQDGTTAGNIIRVQRYNSLDGSDAGSLTTITIPGKILNLSDLFIDEAQNIYVVGNNETDSKLIIAKIDGATSATVISLDSIYAAYGGTPGIANITTGAMTTINSAAFHPDRRIYAVGVSDTPIPYMSRVFGDVYSLEVDETNGIALQGDVDESLNPGTSDGGVDLSTLTGWSGLSGWKAKSVYTDGNGMTYIAFSNGTDVVLGKLNADMIPVTTFGDSNLENGLTNGLTMNNVNNLMYDWVGKIVVVGMIGESQQIIIRFESNGLTHTTFNSSLSMTAANRVVQQKSGRYLVAGKTAYVDGLGGGIVLAYRNDGTLEDATYGPQGSNGFYAINIDCEIDDIVVDQYDDAYIVYRDTTVKLQKVTENGSGRDAVFANGAIVDTGIIATQAAHVGINSEGNILVAASFGASIKTALYNGSTGALIGSVQDLTSSNSNSPIATDITGSATNFIIAAYETTSNSTNQMLVIRIDSTGVLDSGFGTAGITASDPQSAIAMYATTIQLDGKINMVGYGSSEGDYPILMRTYGTPYEEEFVQYPDRAVAGTLDLTLFPSLGDLNLNDLVPTVGLNGFTAKRIYEDGAGKMLIAFDNGTDTILVRLYKDLKLDTTLSTDGYLTIFGLANVRGLSVDSDENMYVSGGATTSWMRAFNNDGSALTGFTLPTSTMSAGGYEIAVQSLDRIVLAGQDATGGVLYGYQSTTGDLDPEFGNGTDGIYKTLVATPIADISIDNLDRIYIVYNDGSNNSVVRRINTNGAFVDTDFGSPTGFADVTGNELQVLLDDRNDHVIVAAATSAGFKVQSYAVSNGATVNGPVTITAAGTSHLANVYVTSDNKIALVGYTETGNILAARLNADLTYDSSFNPSGDTAGLLITTAGNMTKAYDATIHADNRIMIIGGDTGATDPYMCRVYGDDYVTIDIQEPVLGIAGTLDTTLNLGAPYINLNILGATQGSESISYAKVGKALVIDENGSVVVTGETADNHLYLARYLSTGELDLTFNADSINGGPGYVIDPNALGGNALVLDADGKILVTGYASGEGDAVYVARYTVDGILDYTFATSLNGFGQYQYNQGDTGYFLDLYGSRGNGIAVDSLGNIIMVAENYGYGYIARYNSIGQYDTTFNSTGYIRIINDSPFVGLNFYGVAIDQNDKPVVIGTKSGVLYVARYTFAGEYDTTFNTGGVTGTGSASGYIYDQNGIDGRAVVIQADGKILVVGQASGGAYIARYTSSGLYDSDSADGNTPFNGSNGYVIDENVSIANGLAIMSTGSIITIGQDNSSQLYFGSYLANGTMNGIVNVADAAYGRAVVVDSESNMIGVGTTFDELELYLSRYNTTEGAFELLFGSTASVPGPLNNGKSMAVLPLLNGTSYIAVDNGSVSMLSRLTTSALSTPCLDSAFQTNGVADSTAPQGVFALFIDALENIVLTGTDGTGAGWMQRYTQNGDLDTATFGSGTGYIFGLSGRATVALEQSMARIVLAGKGVANGCLRGYEPDGSVDSLFGVEGVYDTGVATGVYTVISDEFDRLILAYKNGSNIDLARLTSNGELDITFGDVDGIHNTGIISSALTNIAADETSIRVSLDHSGNIIVVGLNSDATGVQVAAFDNGVADNNNGAMVGGYIAETPVTGLVGAVITSLVAKEDDHMLIGGYQSGSNTMWIARITSTGTLDTLFNPTSGIKTFSFDGSATTRQNNSIGIFEDGRIASVGYETVEGVTVPFFARLYDNPYQEELAQYLEGQPIGTNDYTFGLTGNNIVTFFATPAGNENNWQKARAIATQGTNRFVVAFDGHDDESSSSKLFINKFNMDGIVDTTFATEGQAALSANYDNEYVKDMVVFTTPEGVNKAILAGYASSTALGVNNSLLIQYNLDTAAFDSSFGGFDQDPVGQSFADIQSHQVVGLQSSGRIITSGLNYDDTGMIIGYTSIGKIDKSFGSDGHYFTSSTDGIFSHAIDTLDRIVFGYIDETGVVKLSRLLPDGSALDTEFAETGTVTTGISNIAGSSAIRVAVDGNGKVVVVAMASNGLLLTIERYNDDGTLDGAGINTDDDIVYGFTNGTISKLIIDEDNKITVVGSDLISGVVNIYVFRILADMSAFDSAFNADDTPGYLIYTNRQNQNPLDACLHQDGRVVIVGSESTPFIP